MDIILKEWSTGRPYNNVPIKDSHYKIENKSWKNPPDNNKKESRKSHLSLV